MAKPGFSWTSRAKSLTHALAGLRVMMATQHNAWLHAAATAVVVAAAAILRVTWQGWCWLIVCIVAVWTAEALNTALELLSDVAHPEFHPLVKKAKDIAAAAVLISALGAVVIGVLVFTRARG